MVVMDPDLQAQLEEPLRQADAILSLLELSLDGEGQAPGLDVIAGAVEAAAAHVRAARALVLE